MYLRKLCGFFVSHASDLSIVNPKIQRQNHGSWRDSLQWRTMSWWDTQIISFILSTYQYSKIFWILLFNTRFLASFLRNVFLAFQTLESFKYSNICFLYVKFQMSCFNNRQFYRFNKILLLFKNLDEY